MSLSLSTGNQGEEFVDYPIWETHASWTAACNVYPTLLIWHSTSFPNAMSTKSTPPILSEPRESSPSNTPRWSRTCGVSATVRSHLTVWRVPFPIFSRCSVDIASTTPKNCCLSSLMDCMRIWIESWKNHMWRARTTMDNRNNNTLSKAGKGI